MKAPLFVCLRACPTRLNEDVLHVCEVLQDGGEKSDVFDENKLIEECQLVRFPVSLCVCPNARTVLRMQACDLENASM